MFLNIFLISQVVSQLAQPTDQHLMIDLVADPAFIGFRSPTVKMHHNTQGVCVESAHGTRSLTKPQILRVSGFSESRVQVEKRD